MSLKATNSDIVLASAARTASVNSDPLGVPSAAIQVLYGIHCTAASGTTPTLDAKLQQSADGSTWNDITGTTITQLTAAGNRLACGVVTDDFVRVAVTIAGASASFTFAAIVWTAGE